MLEGLKHWVKVKYFQYEINIGTYMMDPWEKYVFNTLVWGCLALSLYTAVVFGKDYMAAVVHSASYYMSEEGMLI